MKKINLEEILWKAFHNNGIPKPEHSISKITHKAVKEAMKEACNQVIDLCADNADADVVFLYTSKPDEGSYEAYVIKDSILKVKEMIG